MLPFFKNQDDEALVTTKPENPQEKPPNADEDRRELI